MAKEEAGGERCYVGSRVRVRGADEHDEGAPVEDCRGDRSVRHFGWQNAGMERSWAKTLG